MGWTARRCKRQVVAESVCELRAAMLRAAMMCAACYMLSVVRCVMHVACRWGGEAALTVGAGSRTGTT